MKLNIKTTCLISLLLGALVFVLIYGYLVLNPFNLVWIKNWGSDPEQHLIGWLFFKDEPFKFPLGMFNGLSYPNNVSILYTDSIPIVAIFVKILIKLFKIQTDIQYFGLYSMLCFMLQSMFGMLIAKRFIKSNPVAILVGVFFLIQPVFLIKMLFHTALCSHYLILASILCVLYYKELSNKKYLKYFLWGIISFLSASIHLYFIPFCGIILMTFCILDFIEKYQLNKNFKMSIIEPIILSFVYCAVGLLTIFLIGGFSSGVNFSNIINGENATMIYPSADILAFFDPHFFFSKILPFEISTGFLDDNVGYVGCGTIFLLICSLFYLTKIKFADIGNHHKNIAICLFIGFLISFFISILPSVTYNNNLILEIHFPTLINKLHSIFAANGRFIYIAVYLLNILVIAILSKCKNKILFFALVIGLLVQIYDLSFYFDNLLRRYKNLSAMEIKIEKLDFSNSQPVILNGIQGVNFGIVNLVAYEAHKNNLKLNKYYFARPLKHKINYFEEKVRQPAKNDIFILSIDDKENLNKLKCSIKKQIGFERFGDEYKAIICRI